MPHKLRIAYFAHTLRSDWNNGNAHFLRGLMRGLVRLGHEIVVLEPETEWSIENLRNEPEGERALRNFAETYSDFKVSTYRRDCPEPERCFRERLRGMDIVILHEWNQPELAQMLLAIRQQLGYKLLFHDTHHRASSSPDQLQRFGLKRFDGIISFGDALSELYRDRFGLEHVWTLHEAADTSVFKPHPEITRQEEIVWVGNWGDDERAAEISEFLLKPAATLRAAARTTIYGVRYPESALRALSDAGVTYGGYLPNLDAPLLYARAKATVHVPRQQYTGAMKGIPTIRVFEALACGIPLVSAPWEDAEELFRAGDLRWATNAAEMTAALRTLLTDKAAAEDQALRGLETILSRHTCLHRAKQLTEICQEVMA
jgi:spore maturation protein CgeB